MPLRSTMLTSSLGRLPPPRRAPAWRERGHMTACRNLPTAPLHQMRSSGCFDRSIIILADGELRSVTPSGSNASHGNLIGATMACSQCPFVPNDDSSSPLSPAETPTTPPLLQCGHAKPALRTEAHPHNHSQSHGVPPDIVDATLRPRIGALVSWVLTCRTRRGPLAPRKAMGMICSSFSLTSGTSGG